ncbi:glycosyltransferase [Aeromonas salmonicida]|uniref:Glycosyltransferase domain protein n=1 Tax=Aeromonas salmonicida subsp. pectinolytica 34mel TaxID=1324960 RepID=A0A2D1QJE5_AERSA|nr:glycosyltransferase [Aeromonas salmonicida]ATP10355.1 glycosyltransferase domain protein [Aeromonas salmonicida subsp. pectinolytica 34mel]
MINVSIAVSTYSNRIEQLTLKEYPNVEYIIVHQSPCDISSKIRMLLDNRNDVSYIPTETIGLSKSRNIAIKNSKGKYIIIMDDDVDFSFNSIEKLTKHMDEDDVDIGTYYHRYTDGNTTKNKEYSFFHNRFNIANPSSIDICLRRKSIVDSGVLFDEHFGLGAEYPSGEEMIFLSDCMNANLLLKRYPIEICTHPPLTSGSDFYSTKEKISAKREMFKRVYGKLGVVVFLIFVLKKFPKAFKAGYGKFFLKNAFFN